jgi:hypothetical protein
VTDTDPLPALSVLVVEDNRDGAESLAELLHLHGYDPRHRVQRGGATGWSNGPAFSVLLGCRGRPNHALQRRAARHLTGGPAHPCAAGR